MSGNPRDAKYESDVDPSVAQGRARNQFLRVLREVAPHVLQELAEMDAEKWVTKYHLESAPWVLKHAQKTKKAWALSPALKNDCNWGLLNNVPAHWGWAPDQLEVSIAGWAPLKETVTKFKERVTAELMKLLDLHVAETKRQGDFKVVHPHPQLERHLRWLVRFHVLGETYARIANREAATPQVVRSAVVGVAEFIGLRLRRTKQGRPKGARTRNPLHP